MAIFHLTTKPLSRSSGRSAVAAAAYRTGTVLTDMRQGLTHDYERRFGVEHRELVLPEGADEVYWSRQQLWNAAEFAEVRKDGRTAREWQLALPEELSTYERQALAVSFARELAGRYGCAVDVGVHLPDKEGDQRNHHAHLLATTRVVAGEGLGDKTQIELSDAKRLSLGLGQGRQEIEAIRALWAERANEALETKGRGERIDPRSLAAQQGEALMAGDILRAAALDRHPEIKLGWKATAMERRRQEPVQTERGNQLRAVRGENSLRQNLARQLGRLKELAAKVMEKAELARRRHEARKQAEAERQLEQQRQEVARQQELKDYASRLWARSPAGRAEAAALAKWRQDQELEPGYAEQMEQARAALDQWKKDHPVKSRFFEATGLQDNVHETWAVHTRHRLQAEDTERELQALAKEREALQPQLAQQAAADLQEIAVRLTPEQVRLLLDDAYGRNSERSRQAFAAIERRTGVSSVLDGNVHLQRFEKEGFGALLRQVDHARLESRLHQLLVMQRVREGRENQRQRKENQGREREDFDQER